MADPGTEQALQQIRGQQIAQEYDKLNPAVATGNQESFLNYSKLGNLPNITGDLFKELGETVKGAVTGMDTFFKERIRSDATAQVDNERERTQNWLQGGDAPENVKNSVNANRSLVNTLQTAANQGQISQAYYQMRLDTIARDLRSRYPGYREHIDNVIADLTGGTPANKIITDLFHSTTGKSDPEQRLSEHLTKELIDKMPGGGDYLAQYRQKNGKNPSNDEMMVVYGKFQTNQLSQAIAEKKLKFDQELGKADEHEVGKTALATFRANSSKDLQGNNALFSQFSNLIEESQKTLEQTGTLTPEKQSQLMLAANAMERKLMSHAEAAITQWSNQSGRYGKGNLTPEDAKKIRDEAQLMSDAIKTGLGKDGKILPGILGAVKEHLTAVQNFDVNNILTNPDLSVLRAIAAVHKAGVPDVTLSNGLLAGKNAELLGQSIVNVANYIKTSAIGGLDSMGNLATKLKQVIPNEPQKQGAITKDSIDAAKNAILDNNYKDPSKTVAGLYDPNLLSQIKPADRARLYSELSAPQMLNRMKQLKDQGDTTSFDTYANWVMNTGAVLARPEIQGIAQINQNNRQGYSVVFDPKTLTFNSEVKPGFRGLTDPQALGATVTGRLNNLTAPIIAALKEQGLSNDAIQFKLQEMFQIGNFNLQDITKQEEGAKAERPAIKGTPNFRALDKQGASSVPHIPTFPEGTLTKEDQAARPDTKYNTEDLHIAQVHGKYVIIPNSMKTSEIQAYLKSYADPAAGMAFDTPEAAIERMKIIQKNRDKGIKSHGAQ